MHSFKRELYTKGGLKFNFFNWLWNLKNLALSSDSKNVRNVVQTAIKWLFFKKNYKNVQKVTYSLQLLWPPTDPHLRYVRVMMS